MIQFLELVDENYKTIIMNMPKELKEDMVITSEVEWVILGEQ